MGNPYSRNVKRIPARLVKDPTNIAIDWPYGGTPLGVARDIEFRENVAHRPLESEAWGVQKVELVYAGQSCSLSAVLRELDDDALLGVKSNSEVGAGGHTLIHEEPDHSDAVRAGSLLSDRSFALLVAPEAEDFHPWIIIYDAIPVQDEAAILQASIGQELGIAVVWYGIPVLGKGVFELGMRGDITL